MYNNEYLPKCPLKFNLKEKDQHCSGAECAWFLRHKTSRGLSDIGECSIRRIADKTNNVYDLLLNRI